MFYIKSTNAKTTSSYKCVNLYVINKLQNDHGTIKELSDDHSIVNKMSILFPNLANRIARLIHHFFTSTGSMKKTSKRVS